MALHASGTTVAFTALPAKIKSSNGAILRTPIAILRPHPSFHPQFLSCIASASSTTTFSVLPGATPAQKYVYPDPIPEFAVIETRKFRAELMKKLSKEKDTFGNDLSAVLDTCAEIFSEFLHKEYGGPGTLLVEPFTDMLVALKENNLPGAPVAARASLLWAQNYLDQDWEIWNFKPPETERS